MSDHRMLTVTLPDIGEGVVEGEVIAWLKKEGDFVTQDEPVVVVMTDKATVELPAPQPGKIAKHYFKVGEIAIKDKPLYDIEIGEVPENYHPLAAPPVRKMAKDLGIDLKEVHGTGPEGRILKEDLKNQEKGETVTALTGVKHLMADKMEEAKRSIPDFSFFARADLTRLIQTRDKIAIQAEKEGIKLSFMPFFIKALSLTIKSHPLLNSTFEQGQIHTHSHHNIGIATAGPFGLIVPILKGVEKMSMEEIIHAFEDLKKRALANHLMPSDMKEGTITITNFGSLSPYCTGGTPILYAPQVSILGLARAMKEPVVRNDQIVIRDIINLNFTFDHRVIDGAEAARSATTLINILQNPVQLFDKVGESVSSNK